MTEMLTTMFSDKSLLGQNSDTSFETFTHLADFVSTCSTMKII